MPFMTLTSSVLGLLPPYSVSRSRKYSPAFETPNVLYAETTSKLSAAVVLVKCCFSEV